MQALFVARHGGPEVLEVRDLPEPAPGTGQVRVDVRACGLNFAEVLARKGLYRDAPKPPCVVGYEGAGVIDRVGHGVSSRRVGERVLFLRRFGAHASSVVVESENAWRLPPDVSFEAAAALPVNYLTAHHLLFHVARIKLGEHLLVHSAAGGVGTAILQLCRTVPGIVTYGTCSAEKHAFARAQGCVHPIDYHTLDYVAEVQRLTQGRGVHCVFDALGGRDLAKGYGLLRPGGLLVAYGIANMNRGPRRSLFRVLKELVSMPRFWSVRLMNDNRAVAGVNLLPLWGHPELMQPQLERLLELLVQGSVSPCIAGQFPFRRAAQAHAELEQGRNQGKVLLVPDAVFDAAVPLPPVAPAAS
jgi:synaptic vesicle membrane protein VAT-1